MSEVCAWEMRVAVLRRFSGFKIWRESNTKAKREVDISHCGSANDLYKTSGSYVL